MNLYKLPLIFAALISISACDPEQFTNNLEGHSGENRAAPASTAFYSAPVAPLTVAATVEPVAVVIPPPPPEPVCVPVFRVPCPGDE